MGTEDHRMPEDCGCAYWVTKKARDQMIESGEAQYLQVPNSRGFMVDLDREIVILNRQPVPMVPRAELVNFRHMQAIAGERGPWAQRYHAARLREMYPARETA